MKPDDNQVRDGSTTIYFLQVQQPITFGGVTAALQYRDDASSSYEGIVLNKTEKGCDTYEASYFILHTSLKGRTQLTVVVLLIVAFDQTAPCVIMTLATRRNP